MRNSRTGRQRNRPGTSRRRADWLIWSFAGLAVAAVVAAVVVAVALL